MVEGLPNTAMTLEFLREMSVYGGVFIILDTYTSEIFQEVGFGGLPAS